MEPSKCIELVVFGMNIVSELHTQILVPKPILLLAFGNNHFMQLSLSAFILANPFMLFFKQPFMLLYYYPRFLWTYLHLRCLCYAPSPFIFPLVSLKNPFSYANHEKCVSLAFNDTSISNSRVCLIIQECRFFINFFCFIILEFRFFIDFFYIIFF